MAGRRRDLDWTISSMPRTKALRDLRDQLEHMRRESERKDAIIMQMAQTNASLAARVPELEAAPAERDGSETASPRSDRGVMVGRTLRSQ
jgi:hypothetical protein